MQTAFFPQPSASGPSSGFSGGGGKRKLHHTEDHELDYEKTNHLKQMRVRSPGLDRRTTFPLQNGHCQQGFVHSHGMQFGSGAPFGSHANGSGPAPVSSDGSDADMDADMDMDGGMGASMGMGMGMGMDAAPAPVPMHEAQQHNYSFSASGSGGFGFGPGAEEDDEELLRAEAESYPTTLYPSLTPHPNPHHFSNQPTTLRPKSPLSAQPFTTSLRAPGGAGGPLNGGSAFGMGALGTTSGSGFGTGLGAPAPGVLQPTMHAPLPLDASAIERARAQHGPHCTSIPKLVLSPYPDPATGKQSMWSMCPDCGAVERSS